MRTSSQEKAHTKWQHHRRITTGLISGINNRILLKRRPEDEWILSPHPVVGLLSDTMQRRHHDGDGSSLLRTFLLDTTTAAASESKTTGKRTTARVGQNDTKNETMPPRTVLGDHGNDRQHEQARGGVASTGATRESPSYQTTRDAEEEEDDDHSSSSSSPSCSSPCGTHCGSSSSSIGAGNTSEEEDSSSFLIRYSDINKNDVLLGRGSVFNKNEGNVRYRDLVRHVLKTATRSGTCRGKEDDSSPPAPALSSSSPHRFPVLEQDRGAPANVVRGLHPSATAPAAQQYTNDSTRVTKRTMPKEEKEATTAYQAPGSLPLGQKLTLAYYIVRKIKLRGGRFLERAPSRNGEDPLASPSSSTSRYREVEDSLAIEKTRQSFRHQIKTLQPQDEQTATPDERQLHRAQQEQDEERRHENHNDDTDTATRPAAVDVEGKFWAPPPSQKKYGSRSHDEKDKDLKASSKKQRGEDTWCRTFETSNNQHQHLPLADGTATTRGSFLHGVESTMRSTASNGHLLSTTPGGRRSESSVPSSSSLFGFSSPNAPTSAGGLLFPPAPPSSSFSYYNPPPLFDADSTTLRHGSGSTTTTINNTRREIRRGDLASTSAVLAMTGHQPILGSLEHQHQRYYAAEEEHEQQDAVQQILLDRTTWIRQQQQQRGEQQQHQHDAMIAQADLLTRQMQWASSCSSSDHRPRRIEDPQSRRREARLPTIMHHNFLPENS